MTMYECAVLRFVDHDERVIQRSPAHISNGGDLDSAVAEVLTQAFATHAITQRVIEWAQVRRHFLFHRAGQVTQRFTSLDGRARQDDAVNRAGFEFFHGTRDGQIGLAGSRRAQSKREGLGLDGLHQLSLVVAAGFDGSNETLVPVVVMAMMITGMRIAMTSIFIEWIPTTLNGVKLNCSSIALVFVLPR